VPFATPSDTAYVDGELRSVRPGHVIAIIQNASDGGNAASLVFYLYLPAARRWRLLAEIAVAAAHDLNQRNPCQLDACCNSSRLRGMR